MLIPMFAIFGMPYGSEVLIILLLAVLFLGAKRIPRTMTGMGTEFRRGFDTQPEEDIEGDFATLEGRVRKLIVKPEVNERVNAGSCLIVSADLHILSSLASHLRPWFRRVIPAIDYSHAVARCTGAAPIMTIVDLDLPGDEGTYLVNWLRNKTRTAVVVIERAKSGDRSITRWSTNSGSTCTVLPRSYSKDEFEHVVGAILQKRKAARSLPRTTSTSIIGTKTLPRGASARSDAGSLPRAPEERDQEVPTQQSGDEGTRVGGPEGQ